MSKNNKFKFFKNKVCKKNETDIGNKNKNKLRTIWDWEVQSNDWEVTIIYFFKYLPAKEWHEPPNMYFMM